MYVPIEKGINAAINCQDCPQMRKQMAHTAKKNINMSRYSNSSINNTSKSKEKLQEIYVFSHISYNGFF
ncbi:hypothetical protein D3C85_1113170 [compost metagenome]